MNDDRIGSSRPFQAPPRLNGMRKLLVTWKMSGSGGRPLKGRRSITPAPWELHCHVVRPRSRPENFPRLDAIQGDHGNRGDTRQVMISRRIPCPRSGGALGPSVRSIVRCQEDIGRGNLLGLARPFHGHLRTEVEPLSFDPRCSGLSDRGPGDISDSKPG